MLRGNSSCGHWLIRVGHCAKSSSPGTTSESRLASRPVTVLSGIEPSANFSTLVVVLSRRVHTLPNPSCTSLAALHILRAKPYALCKRDVGFPHTLPDGMDFTCVFRLPCFAAKPPHHRDLLRSFEHHNRYQERFQGVPAAIRPYSRPSSRSA